MTVFGCRTITEMEQGVCADIDHSNLVPVTGIGLIDFKTDFDFDMDENRFIKIYLPALRQALECDEPWKGPEYFVDDNEAKEIEKFLSRYEGTFRFWLSFIDHYFDAKSHNFSSVIDGIDMRQGKKLLVESISMLESNTPVSQSVEWFERRVRLENPQINF